MSKWIRKGDKVLVIAGNDKGKFGEVLSRNKTRVVVQGVNIRKKHMKRRDQNTPAEIVSMEISINITNVVPCDAEGKKVRLKSSINAEGRKELVYFQGENNVVWRTV